MGAGWEDDFEPMAGGVMREHCSRRAPINDFRLHVVAPDHPITAGMPEFVPHYDDDLYVNLAVGAGRRRRGAGDRLGQPAALHPGARRSGTRCPGWGRSTRWSGPTATATAGCSPPGSGTARTRSPTRRSAACSPAAAEWAATGKVTLDLPEAFGEPVPGGDWWPTTLEPMVRDMYEQRKASLLMATGDTVLTDDSLRAPRRPRLALTCPVPQPLAVVGDIAVTIDGAVPTADLASSWGSGPITLDELPDQSDVLWYIQDRLVVVVAARRAAGEGQEVDVEVTSSCGCPTCRSRRRRT